MGCSYVMADSRLAGWIPVRPVMKDLQKMAFSVSLIWFILKDASSVLQSVLCTHSNSQRIRGIKESTLHSAQFYFFALN